MSTGTELSELDRIKQELENKHQMYLRALADFDNYRRRVERDRASAALDSRREILLSLVELLDGFDRALPYLAAGSANDGVRAIHRQLTNLLEAQGVTGFDAVGQAFDPKLHEAIGSAVSEQHPPGTVTDEVRHGYRWGDVVLRPARVRVAQ